MKNANEMAVEVEMHAFFGGAIRTVTIPTHEGMTQEQALDLAFEFGQNDFQPQRMPSVSVGDVIRLDGKRFRVAMVGFEEVARG